MCDSFVALAPATANGTVILAKSADCQVNEAHALVRFPARRHVSGEVFKATHLLVPQAEEIYEVILGKSFWTWGRYSHFDRPSPRPWPNRPPSASA